MRAILIAMILGLGLAVSGAAAQEQQQQTAGGPLRRMLINEEQPGQPARNILRRAWRLRTGVVFPHQRPAG